MEVADQSPLLSSVVKGKPPVKISARLIGECGQLGYVPFGDEYARMADDCGFILKDGSGIPIARIMD